MPKPRAKASSPAPAKRAVGKAAARVAAKPPARTVVAKVMKGDPVGRFLARNRGKLGPDYTLDV